VARCSFHKKRVGTRYVKLVFLHPVGSAYHVVHSSGSGAQNFNALFVILEWAQCGFHKKHAGTHYVELLFLYPVGSADYVVHSGAFEA
jgi:hypothetical protein